MHNKYSRKVYEYTCMYIVRTYFEYLYAYQVVYRVGLNEIKRKKCLHNIKKYEMLFRLCVTA